MRFTTVSQWTPIAESEGISTEREELRGAQKPEVVRGQRKEARRSFGPTGGPLAANRTAVVYWAPSLFHLCPAGGYHRRSQPPSTQAWHWPGQRRGIIRWPNFV